MLKDELKKIPGVDKLLYEPALIDLKETAGAELVTYAIRLVLENVRRKIFSGASINNTSEIISEVIKEVRKITGFQLKPVINATGIILHTNLGRAPLGKEQLKELEPLLAGYSNIEFDLHTGKRSERTDHIKGILKFFTGAEDSIIVNNNAAALYIILKTLAEKKEVIISRGELIEIGGSFRIPEIMKSAGAKMVEVGTTNRTRLSDYENAITKNTSLIFKVHKSNYFIEGFTEEVEIMQLSHLAKRNNLIMVHDTGSGLLKRPVLCRHVDEPDVRSSIANGADLVTFSCDKLLNASQAGIVVGREELIKKMIKAPIMRVLRVDKFAIASLYTTLKYQLREDILQKNLPIFRMLNSSKDELIKTAEKLSDELKNFQIKTEIIESKAQCGGGALAKLEIDSYAVKILHLKDDKNFAGRLFKSLLRFEKPVLGIVREGELLLDVLTIQEEDIPIIVKAVNYSIRKLTVNHK